MQRRRAEGKTRSQERTSEAASPQPPGLMPSDKALRSNKAIQEMLSQSTQFLPLERAELLQRHDAPPTEHRGSVSALMEHPLEELFRWYSIEGITGNAIKTAIRRKLDWKVRHGHTDHLEWFLNNDQNVNHANGYWLREAIRYRLDQADVVGELAAGGRQSVAGIDEEEMKKDIADVLADFGYAVYPAAPLTALIIDLAEGRTDFDTVLQRTKDFFGSASNALTILGEIATVVEIYASGASAAIATGLGNIAFLGGALLTPISAFTMTHQAFVVMDENWAEGIARGAKTWYRKEFAETIAAKVFDRSHDPRANGRKAYRQGRLLGTVEVENEDEEQSVGVINSDAVRDAHDHANQAWNGLVARQEDIAEQLRNEFGDFQTLVDEIRQELVRQHGL